MVPKCYSSPTYIYIYKLCFLKIALPPTVEMFWNRFFRIAFGFDLVLWVITAPSRCVSLPNFTIMKILGRTKAKPRPCRKTHEIQNTVLWSHFRVIMSGMCLRSLMECPRGTVMESYWSGGASLPAQPGVCWKMIKFAWFAILAKLWADFVVLNIILLSFVCLQITCLMICSRIILGFEIRQTLCLPPAYFQEPCPKLSRYLLA